jgi:uncharacterized protein
MINETLLSLIKNQFKLDLVSDHGVRHWNRVAEIGDYLSRETGADAEVVNLFAYLHDSRREEEVEDLKHGLRASIFIQELYDKGFLKINNSQLEKLVFACQHHNNSRIKSGDVTVQTCWDADRLDLGRVGIRPYALFLNTPFAKKDKTINRWSNDFLKR